MKGLGHFPMSEDPEKFIGYLLPVLEKIRGLSALTLPAAPERLERIRIEGAHFGRAIDLDGHHDVVVADRGREHLGAGGQRGRDVGEWTARFPSREKGDSR